MFVFSCYTGLAYVDILGLTKSSIKIGIDGNHWLIIDRAKTNTPSRIPLLQKALDIIEKYKKHPKTINSEKLLPIISNQKINEFLKEIGVLCNIDKNITFHLARHTFATTVTLTNGVPIETVSKMLGHKSISTTQIYSKVVEQKISTDMLILKKKLENPENVK